MIEIEHSMSSQVRVVLRILGAVLDTYCDTLGDWQKAAKPNMTDHGFMAYCDQLGQLTFWCAK